MNHFFKKLVVILLFINGFIAHSQILSITTNGETGTSGTNWSTSGTNPVTITASVGNANINRSVILGYLNNGISVIVQNNSSGNVVLESGSDLVKSAGADATLTLRAHTQAVVFAPITSTSNKINVVLWSDFNNANVGGVALSSAAIINTNGGHFWAGGSSSAAGSFTWNGLTVGNGPSVGSTGANNFGMDLFTSQINTNGGDILLWSGMGSVVTTDGIGMNNNPHLNAGTGNVTLITRRIFDDSNTLSVTTTGMLTLATDASNPWTADFNWATTTSGANVTLTSALERPLQINNFSTLGGLSVGVYDGFGTSFNYTNFQNVNINSNIDIQGPINIHANGINLGIGMFVTARTPAGTINFQAKSGFSTVANAGATRGRLLTVDGGDIIINADADNNNSGELNIDWLTIDGGDGGNILLEATSFVWNTFAQETLPEFYSNLGTLTIRNVTSSNYMIDTRWIAMFGTYAGVTFGREGGTEPVLLNPCTVCANTALNFGTTAFQIAGPIAAYGGNINVNMNLRATTSGSDILLKATRSLVIGENRAVRSNNGDITLWSNADGIANATDGDFIGLYSGVSINSANGLTNQTSGGGTITMAGGTTTEILPSGTVVPTGYALSTRITNWVDTLPPGGVNFGEKRQAAGGINTVNIHSGGGNIVVKGASNSSSAGVQWFSGPTGATQVINSGNGTVTIDGLSTSNTAHGIEFMSYANVVHPTVISSNTTSAAIRIIGETSSTNLRAGYQGTVILTANGIGGGIEVNGKVPSASNYGAIEAGSLNAYALSGPITFIGEGGLGLGIGGIWGKGTLASSSSNIILRSDRIPIYPATIETTDTFTAEPLGNSFASALTFPITNLTFTGNTVSGLTLGKSTNTANITFGSATTIAGPITAYGGTITLDADLTTTNNGDISLYTDNPLGGLTTSRTVNAAGSFNYIPQSDSFNAAVTYPINNLNVNSAGLLIGKLTNDKNITFGAVTTVAGPITAYGGNIIVNHNLTATTGNILLDADKGSQITYDGNGVTLNNSIITADNGGISINGRGGNGINNQRGVVLNTGSQLITTSGNINIIGIGGDGAGNSNSGVDLGTNFLNAVQIRTTGGSINLTGTGSGTGSNSTNNDGIRLNSVDIASGSGSITLDGGIKHNSINSESIAFGSGSVFGHVSSQTGPITFIGDVIWINNSLPALQVLTPGAVVFESKGVSFTSALVVDNFSFSSNTSSLRLGKTTNLSNITIAADVTASAEIALYGNNLNINSNLTTTGTSAVMHLKGNTTIAAGKTITSGGDFTHEGNLIFKSDLDGTAAFGPLGGTFTKVSGITTVERYVPAKRAWRLLTAPLKGATNTTVPNNWQGVNGEGLLLFSPATYQNQFMTGYTTGGSMPNIWKYDSANTQWQSIPDLTNENLFTTTVNNGFLVFATGASNSTNIASGADITTLRPKGDLITGHVEHNLTANKYHLIGNPYASPLNTVAMVQANTGTKVWLIDPGLNSVGGYYTYDGTNWAPTTPAISGNNAYIQSGQGFFVRKDGADATFTISESHKITGNSNDWFAKASSSVSSNEETSADKIRVLLYKQISNEWQLADGILAVNSTSGNNEVDATDTGKMTNFNENIAFRNGTSNLSIEYRALPTTETIQPMRLTGTTAQPYQIRVSAEHYSNSNLQPYLQDAQLGTLTEIPTNGSELIVNFNGIAATAAQADARFSLVYPTPLSNNSPNELTVGIYPNPVDAGEFNLSLTDLNQEANYTLTNILGQQVQEGRLDNIHNIISVSTLQAGVYIIQVKQAHKKFTTKLIIK